MRKGDSSAIVALAILLVAPAYVQTQPGTIRVHVTVPDTQAPIPGVELSLRESPGGGPGLLDLPDNEEDLLAYLRALAAARSGFTSSGTSVAIPATGPRSPVMASSVTDLDGIAIFKNLKPGTYVVGATRQGYVAVTNVSIVPEMPPPSVTSATANVTADSPAADVAFSFSPGTAISGRVRTASGAAVSNVRVTLGRLRPVNGQRRFVGTNISAIADANGEYTLPLIGPGDYSLLVQPRAGVMVYYPGTTDLEKATSFSIEAPRSFVEAGSNMTIVDIVMP